MQAMDSAISPTLFQAAQIQPLAERIRVAAADRTPLRIRGGGSKDFHGLALQGELLDTRSLKGIVSYEPSELVVTAMAGTSLAELEATLAAQGQCLAFEPPHFNAGATVGGMVAAGLSGPARASVGAVRDFVLGLELINGRGEVLRYGGQVMKNVAGYDVSRLMAGSWGTLGLITEVSLKVLPVAPAEATLRFACAQEQALQWLNQWGGQPLPLNASCWLQEPASPRGFFTCACAAPGPQCRPPASTWEARCSTTSRRHLTGVFAASRPCPGLPIVPPGIACGACPCRRRRRCLLCRANARGRSSSGMAHSAGCRRRAAWARNCSRWLRPLVSQLLFSGLRLKVK